MGAVDDDRGPGGRSSGSPITCRHACEAVAGGAVHRVVGRLGLAADHLRLRQDLHLLHRAVQPRPGAEPPVRRDRGRGAVDRVRRLPRGHPPRPERELVRPRPCARRPGLGTCDTERWAGRQLDLGSRPDLAELIRAIDGIRTADGSPAIPRLRFVTSHPWDLSDRLIEAMAECPSLCEALHLPVQSGDDTVLRRMGRQYTIEHYLERLERIRDAVPWIAITTDVIVGFCGETEAQFESTLRLLEAVRYDQVFAAAYSERPGTPATHLADDVPADEKRARLNALLALQEPIGLERNRAWLGRDGRGARRHEWRRHGPRPRRRAGGRTSRRRRAAPAGPRVADGRARTSSSTSPAAADWSAGSSPSASSTRDRTRCEESWCRRDGRAAAPRDRRRHGDRQDRSCDRGRLALLEEGIPAEVISADSRQVYRGLDIGTAKATVEERRGVPHHGLDLVDPDQPFSVADFADHVAGPGRIGARAVAILAGGTGLYLRAVARGLDDRAAAVRCGGPGAGRGGDPHGGSSRSSRACGRWRRSARRGRSRQPATGRPGPRDRRRRGR